MNSEHEFSDEEIKKMVRKGNKIVILFGGVYDLSKFVYMHPGGE